MHDKEYTLKLSVIIMMIMLFGASLFHFYRCEMLQAIYTAILPIGLLTMINFAKERLWTKNKE